MRIMDIKENGKDYKVYSEDQCKICINRSHCTVMRSNTSSFLKVLNTLEHNYPGVYGSIDFKCDYLVIDEEAYEREEENELMNMCKG